MFHMYILHFIVRHMHSDLEILYMGFHLDETFSISLSSLHHCHVIQIAYVARLSDVHETP